NGLNKRSICVDLKSPKGRQLILDLAPKFDVVAENFKGGAANKMGLGYDDIRAVHPSVIYLSVSGFGNTTKSPYGGWPAYAAVAEAMSGLYEWKRPPGQPPAVSAMGAIGDIGTSLFGVIGMLAALHHRDVTGQGQYVDVAMFDSMVSFGDVVINYWSMNERPAPGAGIPMVIDGFESGKGWFIVQCGREHEFERLAKLIGKESWLSDPRFATRQGWRDNIDVIRQGVNEWAKDMTNIDACHALANAGVAAGPVLMAEQVIDDPHLRDRNMIVELERTDGVADPVVIPGNPVKMSGFPDQPDVRPPTQGEHTDSVLREVLGMDDAAIAALHEEGVVG
ncbi:MAG TPA: CaiB/BaiF CoA-transferase family protein, partial [Ilumatobacteraceae bacterium]|nr:CaiB/BaiF CoA-transferase family protein [Ilumatobacteraceae bacterium]